MVGCKRAVIIGLAASVFASLLTLGTAKPAAAVDDFEAMRTKWKSMLDGGTSYDVNDPEVAPILGSVSDTAERYSSSMDKTPDTFLWEDLPKLSTGAYNIQASYGRLRDMTIAWSMRGSRFYQDSTLLSEIIIGLDWLDANWYSDSTTMYGNWWEWQIGIPFRLRDILTILKPELTATRFNNYTAAVYHFLPAIDAPDWTVGNANGTDYLIVHLVMGALIRDSGRIATVRDKIGTLFTDVTAGTGFYADGSLLDHSDVAYTMAYGSALLSSGSDVIYLLEGSAWAVTDPKRQVFYDRIFRSYEPLFYKGIAMDMVRGRNIARNEDRKAGRDMIGNFAKISLHAPPGDAAALRSIVKSSFRHDPSLTPGSFGIFLMGVLRDILGDPNTTERPELIGHFAYNSMDRTVHRAVGWAFGISKSSVRVQNYEMTNRENLKGWYTGDGATYLYNGDIDQFSGNYWPTVNAMRLPGTTTEVRSRYPSDPSDPQQQGDGEGNPDNTWSGGTAIGAYGVSGVNLIPEGGVEGGSLNALKSWFMFDDEVVALGSGIKTTNPLGRRVETVVENRRLNSTGTNEFRVNGVARTDQPGWGEDMADVRYAHLEGSTAGAGIGYYFPGTADIQGIRQTRTGRWADVAAGGSTTVHSNTYLTLTAQHGVDPTAASYSYVLLPNRTDTETGAYAASPDIEVLENSTYVHAARERQLGVTGYNFWTDTTRSAGDLTCNKKASVMTNESAGRYEISISDPTQQNSGSITVEIDRQGYSVQSRDPQVTVVQMSPTIKLNVNVNGAKGRAFRASFALAPPIEYEFAGNATLFHDTFDDQPTGAAPAGWTVATPTSTTAAISATPSDTDKSIGLTDTNTAGSASVKRGFAAQSGVVVAQWRFMEPNNITRLPYFQVWSGSTGAISLYTASYQLRYIAGNGVAVNAAPIRPDTWHAVKLVLDVWNKRYDLYVDDQPVIRRASFSIPVSSVDAISFRTGYSTSPSSLHIDDVSVTRVSPGSNAALGASVTTTSSYESSSWGRAKVNDGQRVSTSTGNGWSSLASPDPTRTEAVTLDLGSARPVRRVDLYPRNDASYAGWFYPVAFTIETSADGVTWRTQVTATNHLAAGGGYQTFTFPETPARYVRVQGTLLQLIGTESRMQLAEIEVY